MRICMLSRLIPSLPFLFYICLKPQQLRRELRLAMVRQIEVEELMQEEINLDADENIVAEAEELYRDATVEVKTLSIKLVLADKAFALARKKMEQLVETIEELLVQIENGDESEDNSSTHSSNSSHCIRESRDRTKLIVRAKRAELSAEVAVREAILAKEETEKIRADKQFEIDQLKVSSWSRTHYHFYFWKFVYLIFGVRINLLTWKLNPNLWQANTADSQIGPTWKLSRFWRAVLKKTMRKR